MIEVKTKNKSMLAIIFALAGPIIFEQFMQTAVQYIDTAMVGSLGTSATAAVGATTTINWLVGGTVSAIGVGFLSYIAQKCGSGETEDVKRASAQSILAVLVSGIFLTVLTLSLSPVIPILMRVDEPIQELAARYFFILYSPMIARCAIIIFGTVLRAAGDTKTPMFVGLAVNIVNLILNFILIYPTRDFYGIKIYGAGLGVEGAAIASAAGFIVGGIIITIVLWYHPVLSPKKMSLKPDPEILKPCLRISFPNMLQRFATSLGYVAFASMINSMGEVATAAHTIANTVESAFYIPGYGMQSAAATLAGNYLGANDNKRMKDFAKMNMLIEVVLMIISGGLLFIFAPFMMGIFSDSAEVIELGAIVLRMVAVSEPFFGMSIIIEGIMQGVGKTVKPFVYNIIGMWGIRIVGTFICITFFSGGLVSAWGCMIAHNLFLFTLYFIHLLSGKWNPLNKQEKHL